MKILYFDCTGGISGDMLFNAAADLSGIKNEIIKAAEEAVFSEPHAHSHGRSFEEVRKLIAGSGFSEKAREYAEAIYGNIARAEAKVHGATLKTVHFHEVGRNEAVKNALGIGMAVEAVNADEIWVSPVYDGKGTIVCSHGEISVPVPAVKALMKESAYDFRTADVDTEMVTPSGLAGLMGIGAKPAPAELCGGISVLKETEARGGRDTGRLGLKAYILEMTD